ncbi:unnamed protein product [Bursaphelenchus okinawaensis]|uniref:hypoxia-inducible factor-proline dioxygenase n=1 Tax=Bursaphelenchus okinawaensis TaxID=465554 RepID=A0A811LAY8_9BILA|nr:unnamed protein product [Bursaphelenchus okinawaensis]CAG9120787.1 unnamed protein product [Bursaphelenchus okinawaensis]
MEKSTFQNAAFQFALNNSPSSVSLSALLNVAEANARTPQIPVSLLPNSTNFISAALQQVQNTEVQSQSSSSHSFEHVFAMPMGLAQASLDATTLFSPSSSLKSSSFVSKSSSSKGCNFCGSMNGQTQKELVECDGCHTVAYCSDQHKKFDWKRHKPICRTTRMKVAQHIVNEPMDTTVSQNSLHSMSASCSSSGFSDVSCSSNGFGQERLIETDDPDINIIETESSPRKVQKRRMSDESPLNPQGKPYKDHSKNLLFKTTLQDHMKSLASSGLALNKHKAIAFRLRYIAEHVIRSLNEYGWAVVDNFMGKTHCQYTYKEIEQLYNRGLFKEGQLMEDKDEPQVNTKDIRSDKIYWFDSSENKARDAVTIRLLVSMIDSVIVHFQNRIPPYQIAGRSRAMIACYPGNGTRYVKHVDNPIKDGRCITSIYYCNDDWVLSDHGGTLRLYPETSRVPMDIDPQGDRLVFFWSDRRNPHEVLPVFRHRYAVTIWYFDQNEKQKAKERQRLEEKEQAEAAMGINSAQRTSPPRTDAMDTSNYPPKYRMKTSFDDDEDQDDVHPAQPASKKYIPDFEV